MIRTKDLLQDCNCKEDMHGYCYFCGRDMLRDEE